MLEARRIQLVEGAKKLASMRGLSEAYQREMDRAVGGTPAPDGPSRLGTVRQRGMAIANLLGTDHPVYATPVENIRAAQAAAEELDKFEGEERRQMAERVQRLLDAAAEQHEAGCRTEVPHRQNDDLPPHRDLHSFPTRRSSDLASTSRWTRSAILRRSSPSNLSSSSAAAWAARKIGRAHV